MTLTREQVIEWAKQAGLSQWFIENMTETNSSSIMRLATLAYSAGRAAGLGEAKDICIAEGNEWDSDAVVIDKNYAHHCAAAIEQLKEQQ